MENKKGSGIFLGVIGVATLIVAIIGATFAFFSAQTNSTETAITAQGAILKLGFEEDPSGLNQHLIPATYRIAEFAALSTEYIGENRANECLDDNQNEVCGVYYFTVGNPSATTQQDLYGSVVVQSNSFANLMFQVYDETNTAVLDSPVNFTTADSDTKAINLGKLAVLPASKQDDSNGDGVIDDKDDNKTFDATKPSTYTKICTYGEEYDHDGKTETAKILCEETNVRTYKLVLWIMEIGSDQTALDGGETATMAAGVKLTSASDTQGVTGIISASDSWIPKSQTPSDN